MLGSALPASATLHTSTSSATPTSPTRSSRLRGLSYLRNYTHNHLHSRSSEASPQPPRSDLPSPREQEETRSRRTREARRSTEPTLQSGAEGWLPTVQGRSGLSRDSLHPTSSNESASPDRS